MKLSELEFVNWSWQEVKELCVSVDAKSVVLLEEDWNIFYNRKISVDK